MFPSDSRENEVTWLIGQYINFAWKHFNTEHNEIKIEKFFGFLMFKCKERDACVGNIAGLN